MSEDSSALPWSINRDDYELQEVIGENRGATRGDTGPEPCRALVRGVRLGWGSLRWEGRTCDRKSRVDGRQAWSWRHWGSWAEPSVFGIVGCVHLRAHTLLHLRDDPF